MIWGEDWHEGVIGIVASRLVERFNRPVVLIAGNDGRLEGLGPLAARLRPPRRARAPAAQHLQRFGGHRAAAGLSIDPANLDAFAAAFAAHADASLADEDLAPVTRIDAIVPGSALTLGLATELERLAPFGLGNPDVTLLVPACEAVQPGVVGEGKHLRFRVRQGGRDAGSAIAFGLGPQLDRVERPGRYDIACRLKENRWNGTVSPQLVVRRLFDTPDGYEELRESLGALWKAGEDAWTARRAGDLRRARARRGRESASSTSRRRSGRCWPNRRSTSRAPPSERRATQRRRRGRAPARRVVEGDEEAGELAGLALAAAA